MVKLSEGLNSLRFILSYLPLLFLACVAGCQTASQKGTHTTVKRPLEEVSQAILLAYHQDLGRQKNNAVVQTNDIPGKFYTLNFWSRNQYGSGTGTFRGTTQTTICATVVNTNKTRITVFCENKDDFDCLGISHSRRYDVEGHALTAIIKTLNQTPAKSAN